MIQLKQIKIKNKLTLLFVFVLIIMFLIIFINNTNIKANNTTSKIIYIDPGHGGFDGGATSNIYINNHKTW